MSETRNRLEIISPGKAVKSKGNADAPADFEGSPSGQPKVFSIVPAPRPYGYRAPVGHPEEENTSHPLRRRDDFAPLK